MNRGGGGGQPPRMTAWLSQVNGLGHLQGTRMLPLERCQWNVIINGPSSSVGYKDQHTLSKDNWKTV